MSAISLPTLLGDLGPLWLVSPIKPILALLPFLPWAWAISTHLEKDSDRLLLGRNKWNAIHMGGGHFGRAFGAVCAHLLDRLAFGDGALVHSSVRVRERSEPEVRQAMGTFELPEAPR